MAAPNAFDLTGGALCLDFANTVGGRLAEKPTDSLSRYEELVAWARQAGVLGDRQARRLLRAAAECPSAADRALRRAVALREAIYSVFADLAAGRSPRPEALAGLNEALAPALARLRVVRGGGGFRWEWAEEDDLSRVVWPVARSAAELLTSGEVGAVRECAAATCGWLFLDRSRNRSRRWCDMKVCGNRSKARRYYERERRRGRRGS